MTRSPSYSPLTAVREVVGAAARTVHGLLPRVRVLVRMALPVPWAASLRRGREADDYEENTPKIRATFGQGPAGAPRCRGGGAVEYEERVRVPSRRKASLGLSWVWFSRARPRA